MFRLYRWLTPRNLADGRSFASLRHAVEREVLVAMAARERGICTPDVVAFTTAEPHSFVIAYTAIDGRSLDRFDPADVDDESLQAIWTQLVVLRRARIAHRNLRLANVFVAADRQVWILVIVVFTRLPEAVDGATIIEAAVALHQTLHPSAHRG